MHTRMFIRANLVCIVIKRYYVPFMSSSKLTVCQMAYLQQDIDRYHYLLASSD